MTDFSYQYEKLRRAIRALILPGEPIARIVAYALTEFELLYDPAYPISGSPPEDAKPYIAKIHSLLETQRLIVGQENREQLAAQLTPEELHELADAFFGLYNAVAEAYSRQQK